MSSRILVIAWCFSLVLFPRTKEGLTADVIASLAWLALLVAERATTPRTRRLAALIAGSLAGVTWLVAPDAYPFVAAALGALAVIGTLLLPSSRRDWVVGVAFGTLTVAPALVALTVWALGDDRTRETLRGEWSVSELSFYTCSIAIRILTAGAATWLGVGLAEGEQTNGRRSLAIVSVAACVALLARVGMRAASIASTAVLPEDAGWTESPALGNLLMLRIGKPLFAPFAECSSYSYAPTLEIVHHTLLSPFGLDLSLVANRVLALGWQLATAAILAAIAIPFVARGRAARLPVFAVAWLVASSSFLAPHLHPDHLLMPWFALALGVAIHAESLPSRLVVAALVVLPVIATMVKLTGAGVGLGLVLAMPLTQRRNLLALGAGGFLAMASLALYERLHPGFWQYTFRLQASHALRWGELPTILVESPGRVFVIAVAMFVCLRITPGDDAQEAARDVRRVLLVTAGFALPSVIAYIKVGGRDNSLLPFSIGAAVAWARVLGFVLKRWSSVPEQARALAAVMGAALAIIVTPRDAFVRREVRDAVRERHARMAEYVRDETSRGRRVVVPQSTEAWLAGGRRDMPQDRWQTIGELGLGHHPEAAICLDRIASAYDSIIIDERFLDSMNSPATAGIAPVLERDFVLVEDQPIAGRLVPSIRLYRRKP